MYTLIFLSHHGRRYITICVYVCVLCHHDSKIIRDNDTCISSHSDDAHQRLLRCHQCSVNNDVMATVKY